MSLRLRQVALVAAGRDQVVADLCAVLGIEVAFNDPAIERLGLHNAVMPVGDQFLEVIAPTRPGTTAERYLHRRGGDGGYMLIFQTDDHLAHRRRVEELGVRIVADFSAHGFTNMQLHPTDTGAAFFEIDQQVGADLWHPAGPDWAAAVRCEVVMGIHAAHVQCNYPVAVAARWASIMDVPVDAADGQRAQLELDDAIINFVTPQDERGEGLAGVSLTVVNPGEVAERARRRGVPVEANGDVIIGGFRFRT